MPKLRFYRSVLLVVLLATGLAGCSSATTPQAETPTKATRLRTPPGTAGRLLFVARSDAGALQVRPDAQSILELDDVQAVTWFSDRPARDAGTSSVTDALKTFGWKHNGDRVGDDAPNATLVATELGKGSVVVELLTATVNDGTVRFTVEFIGQRPNSTTLSDVDLFIDDAGPAADASLLPSGLERQMSGGVVLGRTIDPAGQPHSLVLHLAPGVPGVEGSVVNQTQLFAVASGTSTYSISGDVAVGAWRFTVDPSATGDAAPIVVLKFNTRAALATLAKNPSEYTRLDALTADGPGTVKRLNDLITTVISRAGSGGPAAPYYTRLKEQLTDPAWSGVLVFNASVSELPGDVLGHSTVGLADTQIAAFDIGFTVGRAAGSVEPVSSFFGTVDLDGTADGGTPAANRPDLRALFENTALTRFAIDAG